MTPWQPFNPVSGDNNSTIQQLIFKQLEILLLLANLLQIPATNLLDNDVNKATIEDTFIQQLEELKPGIEEWKQYEVLNYKILNHLFTNYTEDERSLEEVESQSRTEDNAKIRDVIMDNFATKGFWRHVAEKYHGDKIVFEFKNYNKPIAKSEVVQVASYLSKKGCGLFAVIWSRKEVTTSALTEIKHQWVYNDKMIICISDDDVSRMLLAKKDGKNPDYIIKKKISEIRGGLN